MIADILKTGKENAQTGQDLCDKLGCGLRELNKAIETERRQGAPICASYSAPMGYYLAADADELQSYCGALEHRAKEIYKTRLALVQILKAIDDKAGTTGELLPEQRQRGTADNGTKESY